MEFRLLGPVGVWEDGTAVAVGGTKPRTLLAALLLERGRVVPATRLVEVLWGDDPPQTAGGLIQTYVSTLRRALDRPGRAPVIDTAPPGYLLRAEPERIDREVFERLVAEGRRAAAGCRPAEAAARFAAALALWRGPALGGVGGSVLAGEASRLEEARLAVLEDRIAADLALGRQDGLVPELTAAVEAHPTREGLRRHLMVALYRDDRQADALTVFRDGRRILVEELGVEPGPALQAAHEAILRRDDAALDPPPPAPIRVSAPAPAQLPPVPADFTGRAGPVRELVARLSVRTPAGVPACLVSGPGGAGKSTLAARVAHELAAAYPDGQLYAELHGLTDSPVAAETVLGRFLLALGVEPGDLPAGVEERAERYRSLLAGRRVLVLLDDAASEQQVRPLLPGSASCAVLITSRGRLAGLAGVHLTELDVLTADEAGELLGRVAGPERVAAEPEAARTLIEQTGGLPLAVRVVGARLATRRHWTLAQLGTRLTDERRRLDELVAGDQEVRASIALSYRALDEDGRTALRRLGLLGLADFPSWVVAALLDAADQVAENVVERLLDAQLLSFARTDAAGQVRYHLHDLVRIYGHDRALAEEQPPASIAAVGRVLSGWLRVVDEIAAAHPSGGMLLRPTRDPSGTRPAAAIARAVADPRAWFDAEQHALVASVERAAALDLHDAAADLASALSGSLFATDNLFDAWTRTHDTALAAARRAGNRRGEAVLLAGLGQLRYEQDHYAAARTYFVRALGAFREDGDRRGQAAALAALGTSCREQGYLPEARHFLGQAEVIFRELGDAAALAYTDRVAGSVHLELGEVTAARDRLAAALATFRRIGSRRGEAITIRTIGLVHRAAGEYRAALDLCRQAEEIFAEIGDELLRAYAAQAAAKAQFRLGDPTGTERTLLDALDTCRALDDRWGEALTLRTLGELHLTLDRLDRAEQHLDAAVRLWRALDLPLPRARTLRDLARLHRARGDDSTAAAVHAQAVDLFRLYSAREYTELG